MCAFGRINHMIGPDAILRQMNPSILLDVTRKSYVMQSSGLWPAGKASSRFWPRQKWQGNYPQREIPMRNPCPFWEGSNRKRPVCQRPEALTRMAPRTTAFHPNRPSSTHSGHSLYNPAALPSEPGALSLFSFLPPLAGQEVSMDDSGEDKLGSDDELGAMGDLASCLQATFTAENHDSLSDEVTRSLLHLSHEEKTVSMRARLHPARESKMNRTRDRRMAP